VAKFCFRSVELVRESVGWNTGPGNSLRRLQRQQTDRKGCRSDNGRLPHSAHDHKCLRPSSSIHHKREQHVFSRRDRRSVSPSTKGIISGTRADETVRDLLDLRVTRYPHLFCCLASGSSATISLPTPPLISCFLRSWTPPWLPVMVGSRPSRGTEQPSSSF